MAESPCEINSKSPNNVHKSNLSKTNFGEDQSPEKLHEIEEGSEETKQEQESEQYESSNQEECSDDDMRLKHMALIRENRHLIKRRISSSRIEAKMKMMKNQQNKRH